MLFNIINMKNLLAMIFFAIKNRFMELLKKRKN